MTWSGSSRARQSPYRGIWVADPVGRPFRGFRDLCRQLDVLFLNEMEARNYAGVSSTLQALAHFSHSRNIVVIKQARRARSPRDLRSPPFGRGGSTSRRSRPPVPATRSTRGFWPPGWRERPWRKHSSRETSAGVCRSPCAVVGHGSTDSSGTRAVARQSGPQRYRGGAPRMKLTIIGGAGIRVPLGH